MSLNDYYSIECCWDDPCDDCSHWFGFHIQQELLLDPLDIWNAWMYYH